MCSPWRAGRIALSHCTHYCAYCTSPPALTVEDRILVTVSGDSELTRWELATGEPVANPIHTKPTDLRGVVSSADGNWFVTGGYYGPVLYRADGKQPPVHLGHTNMVTKYVFSPDNTMLLSVSSDQTARLWSIPRGQPIGPPLKHMATVHECAWSDDARYLATVQYDGLIRVWQRPVDNLVIRAESGWGRGRASALMAGLSSPASGTRRHLTAATRASIDSESSPPPTDSLRERTFTCPAL